MKVAEEVPLEGASPFELRVELSRHAGSGMDGGLSVSLSLLSQP
jgi:hypothetical protein